MSSWNPDFEISISDSEDENELVAKNFNGREALIFIIDAHLYNRSELLENALDMLRSAFLSGLLVNDKDLIGLVFANTRSSPEPYDHTCLENIILPENCAILLPPRQLNTAIVQIFLRFVETSSVQFGEVYGVTPDDERCNFSHLLRLSMDLVKHCNYLVNNITLVYLTDQEQPHPPNSELNSQALQKAADLCGKDVDFKLIPMTNEFNYDLFYKEFICLIQDIDIESFEEPDPNNLRELLAHRKFKQHFVRRSLGHFRFTLGSNLVLSAQYFNYYQKHKQPKRVLLQRTDSALVRKHRITQLHKEDPETQICSETKEVNIKNAWYEINLGDERMRLSYEQVNRVRNIHSPGMVLLGFKPRCFLEGSLYHKCANFMYPDDIPIEGSKRLFRALWEKCLERDKIAVCLFMNKRKSMPRYVALIPINKEMNSHVVNEGFKIMYLSSTSYIRNFNLCDWNSTENQATDQELTICEKLLKKFKLDFKTDIFCDPDLDQLQSKLLSLAFNVNYETLGSQYFPNPDVQNKRIQNVLPLFEQAFGDEIDVAQKRSLDTASSNANKKVKVTDLSNKDTIREMIKNQTLNACSRDQLFEILNIHLHKKVSKSTKKQDLLDIICTNL